MIMHIKYISTSTMHNVKMMRGRRSSLRAHHANVNGGPHVTRAGADESLLPASSNVVRHLLAGIVRRPQADGAEPS